MNKRKLNSVVKIGMLVVVVSFMIMEAMNFQKQQSFFENSISSIHFECDLAYDEKYELRENIDHNYVQQIIWKFNYIQNYPNSFTSKVLLKKGANKKSLNETRNMIRLLAEDYSNKQKGLQK